MIRVFATKTKWTPTDELAFYGPTPLFHLPIKDHVYVSVTFTWDKVNGAYLAEHWAKRFKRVRLGGPAFGDPAGEFVPGRFVKEGVTFTSRGCTKRCPWCLVPEREGKLRELKIQPGYIVQDNNLLACSRGHIEKVFEMLAGQKRGIEFKGGLDIDYLKPWHVELLKQIKIGKSGLCIACDNEAGLKRLPKALDLLGDFPIDKRQCYALMGFKGDTPEAAIRRCEKIYDQERGFLPFAQFYQPASNKRVVVPKKWRFAVWKWARPAAFRPRKSPIVNRQWEMSYE